MDNNSHKSSIHFTSDRDRHNDMLDGHDRHHGHHNDRHHSYHHQSSINLNWLQTIILVVIAISLFATGVFFINKNIMEQNLSNVENEYAKYQSNSNNSLYKKTVKVTAIKHDSKSQKYYFTYESDADRTGLKYYGSTRVMFTKNSIEKYSIGSYVEVILNIPTPLDSTQAIPTSMLNTSYTEDAEYIIIKDEIAKISKNLTIALTCVSISFVAMIVYSIILNNKKKKIEVGEKQETFETADTNNNQKHTIKNCSYCGTKNNSTNKTCSSCGAKLD